jgi:hypothetical protein
MIKRLSAICALLSLCACAGAAVPIRVQGNAPSARGRDSKTFNYTGAEQSFKVPPGVTQVTIIARGAGGAGYVASPPSGDYPGRGGRVEAVVPVRPGETLHIFVGGKGHFEHGGFNGGGNGGVDYEHGSYAGGGASDVREGGKTLNDRIVVAAGGGGGGNGVPYGYGAGGNGGGLDGQGGSLGGYTQVDGAGGAGGSQTAGGPGGAGGKRKGKKASSGTPGADGILGGGGDGGTGGYGVKYNQGGSGGGGAGGGYYGGGGGGGGASIARKGNKMRHGGGGGGGGGGSSYVEANAINSRMWPGWKHAKGDGLVIISW